MPPQVDNGERVPLYDRALDSLCALVEGNGNCVAAAVNPDQQIVLAYSNKTREVDNLVRSYFDLFHTLPPGDPVDPARCASLLSRSLELSSPAESNCIKRDNLARQIFTDAVLINQQRCLRLYARLMAEDELLRLGITIQSMRTRNASDPNIAYVQEKLEVLTLIKHNQVNATNINRVTRFLTIQFTREEYITELTSSKAKIESKLGYYKSALNRVIDHVRSPEGLALRRQPVIVNERNTGRENRHAELELINHFLSNSGTLPGYIGLSRLSCATCAACLGHIYRQEVGVQGINARHPFFIRGTHNRRYLQGNTNIPQSIQAVIIPAHYRTLDDFRAHIVRNFEPAETPAQKAARQAAKIPNPSLKRPSIDTGVDHLPTRLSDMIINGLGLPSPQPTTVILAVPAVAPLDSWRRSGGVAAHLSTLAAASTLPVSGTLYAAEVVESQAHASQTDRTNLTDEPESIATIGDLAAAPIPIDEERRAVVRSESARRAVIEYLESTAREQLAPIARQVPAPVTAQIMRPAAQEEIRPGLPQASPLIATALAVPAEGLVRPLTSPPLQGTLASPSPAPPPTPAQVRGAPAPAPAAHGKSAPPARAGRPSTQSAAPSPVLARSRGARGTGGIVRPS